jgi:multidrug efflux pump subunit AcrB
MVDTFLPAATDMRESEAFAATMERYISAQPHVKHVTSFVGGGGLRFLEVTTATRSGETDEREHHRERHISTSAPQEGGSQVETQARKEGEANPEVGLGADQKVW